MIILDFHSKTPIYEQIEEQVMLMVRRGVYKPHDRLPSTRSLASELKLNVNTVKRAFQELEAKGVTYSNPGAGSLSAKTRRTTAACASRLFRRSRPLCARRRQTG